MPHPLQVLFNSHEELFVYTKIYDVIAEKAKSLLDLDYENETKRLRNAMLETTNGHPIEAK